MSTLNAGTVTGYLELQDRLSPAVVLASQKVNSFANVLDGLGSNLSSIGRDMLPLTAALTAAGAASTVLSATFEASMTRLVSIAGVSQNELQGVKRDILALAVDTGVGPQMLADGMTKISSTVTDTAVAMDILKIAALGTKAGFGETVAVGGALTAVINSYGSANLTAAQAGNIMAIAIKEGGAEAKELAPTLANVVPFAAQMGISFQEVAANIATLTKLGVPTAEAVTQLTSVMTALTKETKQGAEALTSVGLSYDQVRQAIKEKGLAAALTDLQERFKGNTTGLADVFGRIEALRNIMGTAGVQADTYAKVLAKTTEAASKSSTALQSMADAMDGTTVQTWADLTALVQVLAIQFGDALAPALKDMLEAAMPVVKWAIDAVEWFSKLPGPVKEVAIALGAFTATAPVALMGIGAGISAISGGFKLIGAAITGPAIMMEWMYKLSEGTGLASTLAVKALININRAQRLVGEGWVLMGGPVTAIIAGIVAVGYAWGQYKNDWTRGFDVIIPGLGLFRDGIEHWTEVINIAKAALDNLLHTGDWQQFINILDSFGREVLPTVKRNLDGLPPVLGALTTGLGLANGASVVMGDGLDSAKAIAGGFREELAAVKSEVAHLTGGEKEAIQAGLEMGKGQADIAARLHVSEAAVHMYAEGLHEAEQAGKKLVKSEKEVQKQLADEWELAAKITAEAWKKRAEMLDAGGMREITILAENYKKRTELEHDFDKLSRQATMSKYDFEVSEIQQWTADEITALKANYENWEQHAEIVERISKQKLANLLKDNKELQAAMLEFPGLPAEAFGTGGMSQASTDLTAINKAAKNAAFDGMASFFTALGQISGKEGLGKFMQAAGQMTLGFKAASDSGHQFGSLSVAFDKSEGSTTRFASAVQAAATITQGAIAIWDLASQATTRLGAAFNGAMAGAAAGAAFGPWGAAAGAAVGVVASLFQDKVKKAVEEANAAIDKVKDSLIATYGPMDKLEATAQRVGLTFVNEWGNQGPAGLKKMKDMAEQLEQRLAAVETASKGVVAYFTAAVKVFAAPYAELQKTLDKTLEGYDASKKAWNEAIADSDTTKDKLEDLGRTLDENRQKWQDATMAISEAADTAKPVLDNLGTTAVAAFAAAYAATGDYGAALRDIQAPLADLQASYETLGLSVENVALQHLMVQSVVAEGNPDLMAAIDAQAGGLQGLAQLGLLNVDTFAAMQTTGFQMYTILQGKVAEAGGTTRDALMPMQGYLQEAAKQAKLLGIPLDDNTQMLIDQSKELGLWKDAGKSALDKVIDGMSILVDKVGELLSHMSGVSGAITGLPARKDVDLYVHEHVERSITEFIEQRDAIDHASHGGKVTSSGVVSYLAGGGEIFQPRGTDTVPAMLTPGERVLSVDQNKAYEEQRGGKDNSRLEALLGSMLDEMRRSNEDLRFTVRDAIAQGQA